MRSSCITGNARLALRLLHPTKDIAHKIKAAAPNTITTGKMQCEYIQMHSSAQAQPNCKTK